jgi:hypothetical protein
VSAAADAADAAGAWHALGAVPGLLGRVFERLPPGDRAFTVGALSREWRSWAAPGRRAALREFCRSDATLPLWALQQE